jgi:hypothetical protein
MGALIPYKIQTDSCGDGPQRIRLGWLPLQMQRHENDLPSYEKMQEVGTVTFIGYSGITFSLDIGV